MVESYKREPSFYSQIARHITWCLRVVWISGNGEGVFSTLRRLSTVSRKTRSKKKMFDLDKDIEIISEQESGTDTGTSGYVRYRKQLWDTLRLIMAIYIPFIPECLIELHARKPSSCFSRPDSRSLGSDDTGSSPRTPDGEFVLFHFVFKVFPTVVKSGVWKTDC